MPSVVGRLTKGAVFDSLVDWHDIGCHNWDATEPPDVDNDTDEGYVVGSLWCDVTNDKAYVCLDNTNGAAVWTEITGGGGGGGAPVGAHYLVGEAHADLTEEIVVGATPNGELGGTWDAITVDATHSGSAHHAAATVAADLSPLITLTGQEFSFAVQDANHVLAGPESGAAADPTMRHLVAADIPDMSATYVPKSLYDAQSILAATADNTPAAVTVAEQRLVGRLTGGNIDDIVIGIADDNILQVDQYDAADNDYAKFTANGIEGRSYAEVKQDLDLEDADITTLAKTVKLDDLTAPDANTDLNASTTAHGLMIAAVDPASAVQRHVACTDNAETAWKAADLFDTTHPENIGTATEGTSLLAAHRDHVHAVGTHYITHCMAFMLVGNLVTGALPPYGLIPGYTSLSYLAGEHGAFSAVRGYAQCTAGSGLGGTTAVIVIEAASTVTFADSVTLFTLTLAVDSSEHTDAVLDNAWDDDHIYVRARCTSLTLTTPPGNVRVQFFYKEQVFP